LTENPRARLLAATKIGTSKEEISMRALRSLTFALVLAIAGLPALAQEPISNLPRNQTLIVENPEGTIKMRAGSTSGR
jgi:hypothetical protein